MKKLVKRLNRFDKTWQIKMSNWTRKALYEFITDIATQIRDKNGNEKMGT